MKILHTADWHLGRRLHGQDLAPEQDAALEEIIRLVREHRVDALIHAGDVFDIGTPSNAALRQYYVFLTRIVEAGCGTVIITGGNHDSPAALNAPKDLLSAMNIHVVGGATDNPEDEVIPIRSKSGETLGYCCAVPFLRDKDLRYSLPGETDTERSKRIIAGIRDHYARVMDAAQRINTQGLPIIATGHLFAQGGTTGDLDNKEQIHVGHLGQIGADAFPEGLHYLALGHLHRPQIVGKQERVRYAGSPVALDFSERNDEKQVVLVECIAGKPAQIQALPLPAVRRLVRFEGTLAEVEQYLQGFDATTSTLPAFAEIHLSAAAQPLAFDVNEHFRAFAAKHHDERVQVVRVVQARAAGASAFENGTPTELKELTTEEVFDERLKSASIEGEDADELRATFTELLALMSEGELVA